MKNVLCLLSVLLTLAARADAPSEPGAHRSYIGSGQILTVTAARQLTLDAHVGQVLYQPGSREAAFTCATGSGDTVTASVRLVGFRRGEMQTLLQTSVSADRQDTRSGYALARYELEGWSGDGRYLIVAHTEVDTKTDGTPSPTASSVWESVDVGVLPPRVRRIPAPENVGEGSGLEGALQPSPSGKLFAAGCFDPPQTGGKPTESAFLYDPARDTARRVPLPAGSLLRGWADDTHLLLLTHDDTGRRFFALDIGTKKETPAKDKPAEAPPVPRRFPEVTLSLSSVPLPVPGPNPQSRAADDSLWLDITGAKPRLPSVRLALIAAPDDSQIVLAPDQSSALWVQHGDLYMSRFDLETATVREKYDADEPLTCSEERAVAMDNAKQIGLSLLQYSQDYDEQFPPADNFHSGVNPYIANDRLLTVRGVPFDYTPPDDLGLAHIENAADTVLGTIALPCATVTLYADGHVRSLPPSHGDTRIP